MKHLDIGVDRIYACSFFNFINGNVLSHSGSQQKILKFELNVCTDENGGIDYIWYRVDRQTYIYKESYEYNKLGNGRVAVMDVDYIRKTGCDDERRVIVDQIFKCPDTESPIKITIDSIVSWHNDPNLELVKEVVKFNEIDFCFDIERQLESLENAADDSDNDPECSYYTDLLDARDMLENAVDSYNKAKEIRA